MPVCRIDAELRSVLAQFLPQALQESVALLPVSGLSGIRWRLQGVGFDLLAREASAKKIQIGVGRRQEFRLLRMLNDSSLAPRPLGFSARWLLIEWVPGAPMNSQGWEKVLKTGALAGMLARLHQRQRSGYPLNLQALYEHYWVSSDPDRRSPSWLRLHKWFLRQHLPVSIRQALLHMDVHPGNLLYQQNGGLVLIDWEYAGDGDVALELALLFFGNRLTVEERECFLGDYVLRMPGLDRNHLRWKVDAWLPWVYYLMLLWYESRWQQTGNQDFIALGAPLHRYFSLI
ncbi:phosphotransferase [secondary endosymbiont of Ctenarytaina eucalypti]|uniref:Thiamine kinase n=1 Tax=secondary endosymbiont of Ctenarytaina eucalypti TaxID=1199245 RepID=J3Z4G7_9ENTR|nr:phosphotransferase [secondary endosymbiont of Ctenarytaina eucalypti]AFP85184.1 putative choline kinase involved in LPS biosynthesis [secondary endosymbiont of Ctenarytaina eucalypti]